MGQVKIQARVVACGGLALAAFALLLLARWQYERAGEARLRIERFASGGAEPMLADAPEDAAAAELRYRQIELRGRYDPGAQFLLDNMTRQGAVGYEVLTPFRIPGNERRLLVNRGWVPADPDRGVLPDVAVDDAERVIRGRVDALPRAGLRLGDSPVDRERSRLFVVSFPTASLLAELLGARTFGYQILLDPAAPDGYARDWRAAGLDPDRHLAYAGQWLLLALGAAGVAITLLHRAIRERTG